MVEPMSDSKKEKSLSEMTAEEAFKAGFQAVMDHISAGAHYGDTELVYVDSEAKKLLIENGGTGALIPEAFVPAHFSARDRASVVWSLTKQFPETFATREEIKRC